MRAIERNIATNPNVAAVSQQQEDPQVTKLTALVEQLASGQRELRAELERAQQRNNDRQDARQCYNCGKKGHIARDCRSRNSRPRAAMACFNCNQPGHFAKDCQLDLNSNRAAPRNLR